MFSIVLALAFSLAVCAVLGLGATAIVNWAVTLVQERRERLSIKRAVGAVRKQRHRFSVRRRSTV